MRSRNCNTVYGFYFWILNGWNDSKRITEIRNRDTHYTLNAISNKVGEYTEDRYVSEHPFSAYSRL